MVRTLLFPITVLLFSCNTSSIRIDTQVSAESDFIHVNAHVSQMDTGSIIESLNLGKTVRVVWVMNFVGNTSRFTQYARIDTIAGGYHLFNSFSNSEINVFSDEDSLMNVLLSLKDYRIYPKENWEDGEKFSIQVYIDEDLQIPPISIIFIFKCHRSEKEIRNLYR